jgi:16S rRNA (adenine1518-N6/adenine1519-N6)-dimethyltransferase
VQTLTQIKELLAARGLSPRKALGQNFLIERALIERLCDASGIPRLAGAPAPNHTPRVVLEVGPGTGTLTEELLARGSHVVACELDAGLAALLRERHADNPRFTLVEGDCLATGRRLNADVISTIDAATARAGVGPDASFALVANLPYQAATPLMLNLLIEHPRCEVMGVTIQREVGQRLAAHPHTKDYGLLGIVAQAMAHIEQIATLGPACFWPRPEVTSVMMLLRRRATPLTNDPAGLAKFGQGLFSKRRKQLGSVLGRAVDWPEGVDATMRPEALSVAQFVALHETCARDLAPAAPDATSAADIHRDDQGDDDDASDEADARSGR